MKNLLFSIIILFIASCNEQNEQPKVASGDIYFGHFYGYCVGETCIEIFNLTSTNLYEDKNDDYPNRDKPYEGNFKQLSDAQFEKVKHLSASIPGEIYVLNDTVIGTPDAGDWGGVYFAVNTVEGTRFWLIDQMDANIPESLRPFKAEINAAIAAIQD